ncbi:MAG TPA: PASTA domain-containing protein [Candidatus Hydrogenedentes bacterium]|nr:PASTA domain-containing protein [Candidatus Hydrogenedentota bacterium]HRT64329.1 PASTA domain-containing protein [Candidatus Hydrogenedentota bacterium]
MENGTGTVSNTPHSRGLGRIFLDAISEGILNGIAFVFLFMGWCVRWLLATVFFLAVMAGTGYYVFNYLLSGGAYVKVPDVTLRPITEASLMLAQQGLEVGGQTQVADDHVPKYHVIVQRPAAGKVVRGGRKVYLTVSAGNESLTPPDLVGKTLTEAAEILRQTSFTLGAVARIAHSSPRDTVLAQDPAPTRLVASNTVIGLLVSEGRRAGNAWIMPDLFHKPVQEVLQILAPFGVKPVPNIVNQPDQPMDVVLDQQPAAGSLIQEGDRVVYSVRPSGTIALPDVQQKANISYVVPPAPFDREVRIDAIDRNGTRVTLYPLERQYVNGEPPRLAPGSSLVLPPVSYVDKMAVEIYVDGQLAESRFYENGAEPIVTPHAIQ